MKESVIPAIIAIGIVLLIAAGLAYALCGGSLNRPGAIQDGPGPAVEFAIKTPNGGPRLYRTNVPGGWLVWHSHGLVFMDDPEHKWSIK